MNPTLFTDRNTEQPPAVLRVDASARLDGSVSRTLTDSLMEHLRKQCGEIPTLHRDLAASPPDFVDEAWVAANFTPAESRTREHHAALAASDALVAELEAADILVMGVPLYNFAIPAALKAWVDMVMRARLTFRYTDGGVEGLLKGKRAYVVFVSGGVPAGSEVDFATGYMRHVLGFMVSAHESTPINSPNTRSILSPVFNTGEIHVRQSSTRNPSPLLAATH